MAQWCTVAYRCHARLIATPFKHIYSRKNLIVFSVGPKPEIIDLELFGEPIIQTQTAKLLGILFD